MQGILRVWWNKTNTLQPQHLCYRIVRVFGYFNFSFFVNEHLFIFFYFGDISNNKFFSFLIRLIFKRTFNFLIFAITHFIVFFFIKGETILSFLIAKHPNVAHIISTRHWFSNLRKILNLQYSSIRWLFRCWDFPLCGSRITCLCSLVFAAVKLFSYILNNLFICIWN